MELNSSVFLSGSGDAEGEADGVVFAERDGFVRREGFGAGGFDGGDRGAAGLRLGAADAGIERRQLLLLFARGRLQIGTALATRPSSPNSGTLLKKAYIR
jgi:hypothetical protein